MKFIIFLILLFQNLKEPLLYKKNLKEFKDYFKEIPIEAYSLTLNIPEGIYGPKQFYFIILGKNFEILEVKEIPLPNLPGKFKMFLLQCKKGEKRFKINIFMKSHKKKWLIQSFKEIP